MIAFLWMMACSPGTKDTGLLGTEDYDGPIVLPVLEVETPVRGAFTRGPVEVSGFATPGTWPIESLVANGQSIPLDEHGRFSYMMDFDDGLGILGLRLEDTGGERAVDGRAVHHGSVRDEGDWVEDGIRVRLSGEFLDDDEEDLDDVAGFAEAILSDSSLTRDLVGTPIVTDTVTITPTYLYYSDVSVDLRSMDGYLLAEVTVLDPYMEFDLDDIAGYSWLSTEGSAGMDWIEVTTSLRPEVIDGTLEVEVRDTVSTNEGFELELDWVPGFVEDFLVDYLEDELQSEISNLAEEELPQLIAELLGNILVEGELGSGLSIEAELVDVGFSESGVELTGDARIISDSVDMGALPEGAGSLNTAMDPEDWNHGDAPLMLAVDDDLANQLLFGVWAQGSLGGLEFSGLKMGLLSGAPLPEPLGPADLVKFDLELPPVFSAPTDEDNTLDMSAGEFRIVFEREDGEVLDFSVNLRLGASLLLSADQELSMEIDNRPSYMTLEVGTVRGPEALDPGDLAAFIRLIVPAIVGNASNFLPDFAIPAIPLGELVDLEELAGMELLFADVNIEVDQSNWTVITGEARID